MDKTELQLESLKMVKEWSTWLVGIQVAICGFLWNTLKENAIIRPGFGDFSFPGVIVHLAWLLFVASLLIAAFLLLRLPAAVEALQKNEDPEKGVFAIKVDMFGIPLSLTILIFLEYFFFFAGAVLAVIFVLIT